MINVNVDLARIHFNQKKRWSNQNVINGKSFNSEGVSKETGCAPNGKLVCAQLSGQDRDRPGSRRDLKCALTELEFQNGRDPRREANPVTGICLTKGARVTEVYLASWEPVALLLSLDPTQPTCEVWLPYKGSTRDTGVQMVSLLQLAEYVLVVRFHEVEPLLLGDVREAKFDALAQVIHGDRVRGP